MYGTPRITICLVLLSACFRYLHNPQSAAARATKPVSGVRTRAAFVTVELFVTFSFVWTATMSLRFGFPGLSGPPVRK
jgi:hypothetical protein